MNEGSTIHFPTLEKKILERWEKNKIFEKSLDKTKNKFVFYDGPPFATGLPHYGHFLPNTLKDIVPRYWTMRGFCVERRWGWDCHGLPIEQEIDQKFKLKSAQEIEKFGIARYNQECRDIVLRFSAEWEKTITRLGRWVNFKNGYRTMDRSFMESVWWVLKELWNKGLIYRGYKVTPFSTALGTPLSNFEASSNYQDVQDPSIVVTFPLKKDPSISFLAWTTTPWTLPSNLALAIKTDIPYVQIEMKDGKKFILAEPLLLQIFKSEDIASKESKNDPELLGLEYEPLFPYFSYLKKPCFTVIESDHVTIEQGTGIVHMAPAFGEEDFYSCQKVGISIVCPVDNQGCFTQEVKDYAGLYVKEADKKIIADLKQKGRLIKHETIQHAYPFCPRTDTPLIYKAVSSWFVKVDAIKDQLIQNNLKLTHWVPEHLREGRFGKWLEGARDWAISRNRYWGNPIPIFEAFEEPEGKRDYLCLGSVQELEDLTHKKFPDIHREHLEGLILKKNGKKYRWVPEVLDCWFESGAMPYAQYHYPFENKKEFEENFPAQFIAEGLDQTRGWFYTLSVLGTALFNKSPFQHVVVNGLILAEDGKKMSKRLKNYPDPQHILENYGADALRLYLIDSPAVRAEEFRFSEAGVKEIVRRVSLKWWNAYSFFQSYAQIDKYEPSFSGAPLSKNILDHWIISKLQTLLFIVEREMTQYHLYQVVPALLVFIDDLTNTYIRLNRSRFWEEGFAEDKKQAFDTLYFILLSLTKMMAPFTPFLADELYLLLTKEKQKESVHLENYPQANEKYLNKELEQGVSLLEEVILLARNIREQNKIKIKIPLKELVLVHRNSSLLKTIVPLENYLKSELNVKKITYRYDEELFVTVSIKPNGATLGKRVGPKMPELSKEIAKLTLDDLQKLDAGQTLKLLGFDLELQDLKVLHTPVKGEYPVGSSNKITVALDTRINRDQELEGLAREVVNRIQKLRKDSKLNLDDRIHLQITANGALLEAIQKNKTYIQEQTLALTLELKNAITFPHVQAFDVDEMKLAIALNKAS